MKNVSLTVKIWLALSSVSLLLYLVVLLITPTLIRNFFTDNMMQPPPEPPRDGFTQAVNERFHIRSFILLADGTTMPAEARLAVQGAFLEEIRKNAEAQVEQKKMYQSKSSDTPTRYVIVKGQAYERPMYQVMFLKKPEEDRFVKDLLTNFMLYVGLALVACWFVSLFMVRYLTRPLTLMEQHVKRIANRKWQEPLDLKRTDELGRLAQSIDSMRQQLIKQDEAQQSMLQNISHELKTPVMVIRSYAQAMQDGVYPKGDLNGSIEVIDQEGERLEKLIKQLLYLTRLDYLATQTQRQEQVRLDQLIEKTVQRLGLQRPDIALQLELQPITVQGDEETLRVMVENLFDNHLRYANSQIRISLENPVQGEVCLSIWNDGSHIDAAQFGEIGKPFHKGPQGKYGLGLAIVQRIIKPYRGDIALQNEDNGVVSRVKMHLKD